MKISALLIVLFLMGTVLAQQPPFTVYPASLPLLTYSATAWGDCDHDGDLDLAVTGASGNDALTAVFINNAGTFVQDTSSMEPLHFGSIEWGDHDLDGDLDLLVSGITVTGTPHTVVYTNNGDGFTDAGSLLPGIAYGQATWGDFDRDGDPDILMAGGSKAQIFRNNGNGQLSLFATDFPAVATPMVAWNDYNNDGQSDALICGDTGGGIVTELFRNDQGVFTKVNIQPEPFHGLYGGQARWADLDLDGDQDLVINGMDLYVDAFFLVYRNDGNDHFTKFDGIATGLLNPWFDLADFDNDGLTDIMVTGANPGCGGSAVTRLLQNTGSMNFTDVSTLLPGYKLGSVAWGDCNGDGYSDLLFTGLDSWDNPQTDLYLNNLGNAQFAANTPPVPPANPLASVEPGRVVLAWAPATDLQTPSQGLSYNIRVGTAIDQGDILSPLSILYTGNRLVAAPGNAGPDTAWVLTGLAAGTYWFSVQAVDAGFAGGGFSEPVPFTYSPAVGIPENEDSPAIVFPNPCKDLLTIEGKIAGYRIMDVQGKLMSKGQAPGAVDVSAWAPGVYILLQAGTEPTRVIKQ
mgnify:CR=1 FL=1